MKCLVTDTVQGKFCFLIDIKMSAEIHGIYKKCILIFSIFTYLAFHIIYIYIFGIYSICLQDPAFQEGDFVMFLL